MVFLAVMVKMDLHVVEADAATRAMATARQNWEATGETVIAVVTTPTPMAWYMAAVVMAPGLAKAIGSSATAQVALSASAGAETYVLFARSDTESKLRPGGR